MITDEMVIEAAWEMYADQYREGMTLVEISRRTGLPRTRVTAQMKRLGAYDPARRVRQPKSHCKRDHDLAIYGRPTGGVRGGRYCGECHRLRAAGEI